MKRIILVIAAAAICGTACSNNPNKTRQQAAEATKQLKQASREAAGQIKKGAEAARPYVGAVAQGVRDGLKDKQSSLVDLNHAWGGQLMSLPGIHAPEARAIIHHRPYTSAHDVVTKGAITEQEYQRIASKVTVAPQ